MPSCDAYQDANLPNEQVKRSERQMLEELYGHMTGLQQMEKDAMMDEEPEIMQRRAAIKQVVSERFLYRLKNSR